jgi:fibronectin-binding autotransporter adhesin
LQNSIVTISAANGLTFASGNDTVTIGGLAGASNEALADLAATPNGVALTVGNNNSTASYTGVLSGNASNAGSLTKIGAGTQTIGGASTGSYTYTGATTINGGTLAIQFGASNNSGGVLSSSSALTIGSTGTLSVIGGATAIVDAQAFSGSTLSGGLATIAESQGTASQVNLTLGSLTRSNDAMVNFTLPTTGTLTVTSSRDLSAALLGTWASVGNGATLAYAADSAAPTGVITSYGGATADAGNLASLTSATTNYTYAAAATPTTNVTGNTLRYTGAATTTALGANSLTLNGLMNAGTGLLTITGTAGSPGLVTGAAGELDIISNTFGITISSVVSGGGSVVYGGPSAGVLTLSGANTYTGGTFIDSGTLQLGAGGATGTVSATGTITVAPGATLALDLNGASNASAVTDNGTVAGTETAGVTNVFGGAISGAGGFTQSGVGTTILTGANLYTGATLVNAGALQIGNGSAGSISGGTTVTISTAAGALAVDLANTGTLSNNITDNGTVVGSEGSGITNTLSGIISGTGGFTQSGLGATTLTNSNTYAGVTSINGGVLALSFANANSNGIISSSSPLTLGSSGALTETATVSGANNQTFNGTTLSGGFSTIGVSQGSATTLNLTLGGLGRNNGAMINFSSLPTAGGVTLSVASLDPSGALLGTWASVGTGGSLAYAADSSATNGVISALTSYPGTNTDNTGSLSNLTSPTTNYTTSVAATLGANQTGNTLQYTGGANTIALGTNSLTLNGLMNAGSGLLTITGAAGSPGLVIGAAGELDIISNTQGLAISSVISGTGNLAYGGPSAGTLILAGANTYSGGTYVDSGVLQVGNGSTGSILSTGGAVTVGAGATLALDLTPGGVLSNAITNNGTVTGIWANGANTLSGIISGTGVITLNSANAGLVLSGVNTFTGGLNIQSGTVTGFTSANAFGANASVITLGSPSGSANATLLAGTTALTFANPILLAAGDTGTLSIGNTNNIAAVTFSGGVTGANNLTINNSGVGTIAFSTAAINNNGAITNIGVGTGVDTISAPVGTGASGLVTGILENSPTSALTISGALTVAAGGTTLTNNAGTSLLTVSGGVGGIGNLVLNNNSATNSGISLITTSVNNVGTVTNSGTGAGSTLISAVIGTNVTGVFENSATSGLVLSGANTFTYNGTTNLGLNILAGTVTGNATAAFGAGQVTLGNTSGSANASLLAGTTALTFANPILLATGTTGVLTIGNTNNIAAATFSGSVTGTNSLTINNSSTNAAANAITLSGASINNIGTITNIGSSTGATTISSVIGLNVTGVTEDSATSGLTLSGANTTAGVYTVNAGILTFSTASASTTSTVALGGGTLVLNAAAQTMGAVTLNAGLSTINPAVAADALTLAAITRTGGLYGLLNFNSANVTLTGGIKIGNANDATGMIGAWASTGSGTSLSYVKDTGSNTVISAYGAGTAATATNVTGATTNYTYAAGGTLTFTTTPATGNTLQNTGTNTTNTVFSTNTEPLTLNGLMNSAASALTVSGANSLIVGANKELDIISNNAGVTISAVIADSLGGASTVVYGGPSAGILTLSGNNIFTGGLAVDSGTVILSGTNTAGSITINAGTVNAGIAGALGAGAITLGNTSGGNNATLLVSANGATFSNPIVLATGNVGTLTVGTTGSGISTTFSGGVTGTNNLVISNGGGASGAITFSNAVINNAGTITLTGSGSGATTISGGVGTGASGFVTGIN